MSTVKGNPKGARIHTGTVGRVDKARHIADIENGEANPSFEALYAIITVLGTSFDAVFNPSDEQAEREIQELAGLYRACP